MAGEAVRCFLYKPSFPGDLIVWWESAGLLGQNWPQVQVPQCRSHLTVGKSLNSVLFCLLSVLKAV